jgi:hypothetical protein
MKIRTSDNIWNACEIWRNVVLCLVVVIILHYVYSTESLAFVFFCVSVLVIFILIYDITTSRRRQEPVLLLSIIMFFAPPSLIFDYPVTILGAKLIPAYILCLYFPIYLLAVNKKYVINVKYLSFSMVLLVAGLLLSPFLFFFERQEGIVEISLKAQLLLLVLSVLVLQSGYTIFGRYKAVTAFSLLVFVVLLQCYEEFVFLVNNNNDPLLWFDTLRWVRYGFGYTGDRFNPARMYAFVWDPNYLISVVGPLYLLAVSVHHSIKKRIAINFFFFGSVVMTLSYQSIVIALLMIACSRVGSLKINQLKRLAIACAYMLPVAMFLIALFLPASMLPPPTESSSKERLHILWAVSQAIVHYPLGIGIGTFEMLGENMFFDSSMTKTLPPHGWLFEIMVSFGLVGYYLSIYILSVATRKASKLGNISLMSLLFWGVTSPALSTIYFWIFLGFTLVLSNARVNAPDNLKNSLPGLAGKFSAVHRGAS